MQFKNKVFWVVLGFLELSFLVIFSLCVPAVQLSATAHLTVLKAGEVRVTSGTDLGGGGGWYCVT